MNEYRHADHGHDRGGMGRSGFRFERRSEGVDLSVEPIETSKDDIEQPPLAKHDNMYIPPLGSSVVISGKSGSGKSTLLANLLTDGRFYGPSKERPNGWFEKIFLFSPLQTGTIYRRVWGYQASTCSPTWKKPLKC